MRPHRKMIAGPIPQASISCFASAIGTGRIHQGAGGGNAMTMRIAGALFCLLLLASTGEAFAADSAMGQVSTTRLKAKGNNGASSKGNKAQPTQASKGQGVGVRRVTVVQ